MTLLTGLEAGFNGPRENALVVPYGGKPTRWCRDSGRMQVPARNERCDLQAPLRPSHHGPWYWYSDTSRRKFPGDGSHEGTGIGGRVLLVVGSRILWRGGLHNSSGTHSSKSPQPQFGGVGAKRDILYIVRAQGSCSLTGLEKE